MTQDLGGALQRTLATAGVSTAVALDVAAVMIVVVAAAGVVAMVRARRAVAGAQAAALTTLVFEHSPAGMALTDAAGRLRAANPTLARWCASTPLALVGRHLGELVEPADADALAAALRAGPTSPASIEVRLLSDADQGRWVRLRIACLAATATTAALCVIHLEDVGEHRAATARLAHEVAHDALTGLPNRRSLIGALEVLLARGGGGAVVMVDLDGFKAVNDDLGHAGGDELLVVVAERLASCLRPGEMAARLGGDELVVLARQVVDQADARAVGQRVLAALVGPVSLSAGAAVVRASIGVRRLHAGDSETGAVLHEADVALYRAKAAGGCCVRHAHPGRGRTDAGVRGPALISIGA